jgi:uncharacterized protein YdeI (YjbR/CyaY-like superfamily)
MPAKRFSAPLARSSNNLGWTVTRIPFDAAKLWKKRGQIRVRGTINEFEFRATLFPDGDGSHYLLVNKKMQKGGHAHAGDKATFTLEPDKAERPIVIPAELEKLFKQEKALRKFFNDWSDSGKRWVINEIAGKKSTASRQKRVGQLAEQMLETIEAERELPPMIARAFADNPQARTAWKNATPLYRRQRLYAIFYYRNVDSRAKRVQKVIEELLKSNRSDVPDGE